MRPEEIEDKEFLTGFRGYVRTEVQAYLRALAAEIRQRDELIDILSRKLSEENEEGVRRTMIRRVGEEVSAILEQADASAELVKLRASDQIHAVDDQAAELLRRLGDAQEFIAEVARETEVALSSLRAAASSLQPGAEVVVLPQETGTPEEARAQIHAV